MKEQKKDSLQLVKQQAISKPTENKVAAPPLTKQVNTVLTPVKNDSFSNDASWKDTASTTTMAKMENPVKPNEEKEAKDYWAKY